MTTEAWEIDHDRLARVCAANDPHQPWKGDDPNPAPHHSIMVASIRRDIEAQGFRMIDPNLDGITALAIAEALKGKWMKQGDERDTEKVKRIFRTMLDVYRGFRIEKADE